MKIKARKFPAKFNVSRLKRFMLEPELDVNASLQVKTGGMHNLLAFGPDLHNRAHVMSFDWLASLRRKLLAFAEYFLTSMTIASRPTPG